MEDLNKKIINIISNTKSIDDLPLLKDFKKELDNKDYPYFYECFTEAFHEIGWKVIKIKDGTEVTLVEYVSENNCFNDYYHGYFYYIKDIDIYICLDCGLKQKLHEYESDAINDEKLLLPADWNKYGIESYLKRRIKKQREKRERHSLLQEERIRLNANCSNCMYMQHGECILGNIEFKLECDDWKSWE